MFGCIVAGRLVQTNLQVISSGKFLFQLDNPSTINHLVIFLTGERPFDDGFGATIYSNTDRGIGMGSPWQFLGVLTNDKPSAIFKLSNTFGGNKTSGNNNMSSMDYTTIDIGISIEPIAALEQLLMESNTANVPKSQATTSLVPTNLPTTMVGTTTIDIARKVAENVFNYLMSFTRPSLGVAQLDPTIEVVPIRVLQDWYASLLKRATTDPLSFLKYLGLGDSKST